MTGTALVARASVEELVGFRDAAVRAHEVAVTARHSANQAWSRATSNDYVPRDYRPDRDDVERYVKELDQACWRRVVRMTDIEKLMDLKTRKEFNEQIDRAPPPFTVDNILATITDLLGRADEIFHSSVVATFERLPREYKSNDGFKYGQRIIFGWACGSMGTQWGWSFYAGGSYSADTLQDLDRVFSALDTQKHDGSLDAVPTVQEASRRVQSFTCESRYFKIKGFAKGSLHVTPKRKDLLVKANQILAAHYGWQLGDGRKKDAKPAPRSEPRTPEDLGQFDTPMRLAAEIVERAEVELGMNVLEPSAGLGNLVDEIEMAGGQVMACECDSARMKRLSARCALAGGNRQGDFLQVEPYPGFDRVIMNPPFAKEADIDHVMHAAKFLRPGGRLVAVMSAGTKFRTSKRAQDFRSFVAARGGSIEDLPEGSFKVSGTGVNTVLVSFGA
jgi:predicted RNA methylase